MGRDCPKCGAECEGEYLDDHPCIDYICEECGESFCSTDDFMEMMEHRASSLRDLAKYGDT